MSTTCAAPAQFFAFGGDNARGYSTHGDVLVNPDMFLTAEQVSALVAATPWPYNVLVHVAAWSGLRAAEIGGLQVGDVELPPR